MLKTELDHLERRIGARDQGAVGEQLDVNREVQVNRPLASESGAKHHRREKCHGGAGTEIEARLDLQPHEGGAEWIVADCRRDRGRSAAAAESVEADLQPPQLSSRAIPLAGRLLSTAR